MEGRFLYFEKFRLDLRTGDLFREDRRVRLPPQPTKLLLLLARSPGALVTHEEIQKEVWGEDTFVDFEQAIKKCVKQVRSALGDDVGEPVYVETVPRRGYRFIGPLRVDGEVSPYPGLSAFLEKDARFFFGREGEAEALWNKIERRRLLALIGPSGAGKSSFLRAGLLPSRREGWRVEIVTPGNSALSSLPVRDTENGPFLLVVDAFEELFTRNPPEVQKEFSERLGSLSREKDTHVLLSMRDDFLFRCHEQESLQEVFLDITPLGPLSGPALRLALEKPAAECGYRFEEGLVEEMVREVEKLPLLAFAAAQLWEKRDREKKVLTRAAYEEIGRAGGALAQHAERTLQSIGPERQSTVREIFRNLTTSQGTRVSMGKDALLSIFPDLEVAGSVLSRLVDARLLTSSEGGVEIIHESLLTAWPRLTQWQAQDAEGTVLRDQLRQAARLWEERGRIDDLLWTGTAFRDFTIWRERYGSGLTATEEEFAVTATKLAGRRRRQRRIAVSAGVALLLAVSLVTTSLWRRAVDEVSRREAAQILALGRLELEDSPTAALAHALASLERADSDEARRFAVEALWHGASAFVLPGNVNFGDFSPDGNWIATGGINTGVRLWSIDGGPPKTLGGPDGVPVVQFSPGSDLLAAGGDRTFRFWSIPQGIETRNIEIEGGRFFLRRGSHLFSFTIAPEKKWAVRDWSVPRENPEVIAVLDVGEDHFGFDIDASGKWVIFSRANGVYVSRLQDGNVDRARLLGMHDAKVVSVAAHPTSPRRFVSGDESGKVHIWSFSETSAHLDRAFPSPAPETRLDPTDSWMVVTPRRGHTTSDVAYVWDLKGPPDAETLPLRNGEVRWLNDSAVHPQGSWLLTGNAAVGILWPLHAKHSRVVRGQSAPHITVAFTPDGNSLASTSDDGTVRLWPLSSRGGEGGHILMEDKTARLGSYLAVDPAGKHALVVSRFDPRAFLVPLQGGEPRLVPGFTPGQGWVNPVAFSPDGRLAVAAGNYPAGLRIWDLESEQVRMFETRAGDDQCGWGKDLEGSVWELKFLADGRLLTTGADGILVWDLEEETSHEVRPCTVNAVTSYLAVERDRPRFLVADVNDTTRSSRISLYDLEIGTSREISSHGNRISAAALDPTGTIVVTGDFDGVVRVGPVTGEDPHLLFGHTLEISSVAVSADGKWIASGSQDGTIRLWPMPEGTPFHTLPYDQIVERIRSFTNLRVVRDESSDTGYRVEVGPFPGWKTLPVW